MVLLIASLKAEELQYSNTHSGLITRIIVSQNTVLTV